MRIISEFYDYYDCIQREGQDQSLVYLRKKVKDEERSFLGPLLGLQYKTTPVIARQHLIGFCGKVYPCVQLMVWDKNYVPVMEYDEGYTTCYSLEEVDAFFKENFKEKDYNEFHKKGSRWNWNRGYQWNGLRYYSFMKFFEEAEKVKEKYTKLFEEKHSPIFVASAFCHGSNTSDARLYWNCSLKHLEFMRVFDPYSAFQEIQMFLGGLASPEKEIPEMTDEVKAFQKGFDKWSFRKPPTK